MTTIAVTGGSGKLGHACIKDLLEHGYSVVNLDANVPQPQLCHFTQTDFAATRLHAGALVA